MSKPIEEILAPKPEARPRIYAPCLSRYVPFPLKSAKISSLDLKTI